MLFNSFPFLVFLPLVYLIYWLLRKRIKYQNVFIIISSYIFYGFWDWRFLFLIFFSSFVDFTVGHYIAKSNEIKTRKYLLFLSLASNLGLLGIFKYYNFFIESFVDFFLLLGVEIAPGTLQIILPVGISFYTFQTLSYTIDVYKSRIDATKDIFAFFAFVSFFPQLVAGPIERARSLLPQFQQPRIFNKLDLKNGLRQMLAGFFKKMVIADNCGPIVDQIFAMEEYNHGLVLVFGVLFFAFQIYCDFSGYSDIGIGVARIFGFNLNRNFNYPYFSSSVRKFWQNWHISLSSWFRDYLYIPLGGSKKGLPRTLVNLLLTFVISGLWHGANFTFIFWGLINGIYLVIEYLLARISGTFMSNKRFNWIKIILTFTLINITWVFFRAKNLPHALSYLNGIFTNLIEPGAIETLHQAIFPKGYIAIGLIGILLLFEILSRKRNHFLDISDLALYQRIPIYLSSILLLILFGSFYGTREFIYFQF